MTSIRTAIIISGTWMTLTVLLFMYVLPCGGPDCSSEERFLEVRNEHIPANSILEKAKIHDHFNQKASEERFPAVKNELIPSRPIPDHEKAKINEHFNQKLSEKRFPAFKNELIWSQPALEKAKKHDHFNQKPSEERFPSVKNEHIPSELHPTLEKPKIHDHFQPKPAEERFPAVKNELIMSHPIPDHEKAETQDPFNPKLQAGERLPPIKKKLIPSYPIHKKANEETGKGSKVVYDPNGPGEMGKAVIIEKEYHEEEMRLFQIHQFNLMVSNRISLNRSLPDARSPSCVKKKYPENLPKTSVIIIYNNEAWSTLLRNVHSVINRSPHRLLEEIILVDDASTLAHLGTDLDRYVAMLPVPVRIVRLPERGGLIRARLRGAEVAKGEVLTFLDSHCECTDGWLEPLLSRIAEDRTVSVCPVIDSINDQTFKFGFQHDVSSKGGMAWGLTFIWIPLSAEQKKLVNEDNASPVKSPTMAGGLFAIDKEYFHHLGAYDPEFRIWGAENIELSLKLWMCGGSLEIHPCSHVGHVFRKQSPYHHESNFIAFNNKRLVEVWMEDTKELLYKINPSVAKADPGDLSDRLAIRQNLNCSSFQWYLNNVYPEYPLRKNVYKFIGKIISTMTNLCLDTMQKKNSKIGMYPCHGAGGAQMWLMTNDGEIQSDGQSLVAIADGDKMFILASTSKTDLWTYDVQNGEIRRADNMCFTLSDDKKEVQLEVCDRSTHQKWRVNES